MNKLASQYGKALFDAAYADNSEQELKSELDKINASSNKKDSSDLLIKLINSDLLSSFKEIYEGFSEKYNECYGTLDVEIISAFPLTEFEKSHISSKIEYITGKKVNYTEQIDTSLIGGILLRFDGYEIDGSVKTQLLNIRKNIG